MGLLLNAASVAPQEGPRQSLVLAKPEAARRHTASPNVSCLVLTKRSRLLLWFLVAYLEFSSGAMLALWAHYYVTHDKRQSLVWVIKVYFLFSDGYNFIDKYGVPMAVGYMCLSCFFFYRVVRIVIASVRHRELRFGLRVSMGSSASRRLSASAALPEGRRQTLSSSKVRKRSWFVRWAHHMHHSLSVHGRLFELRLLCDEIFELVFQVTAAYSSSRSISNTLLNQTYGVVILLNSISTIVFKRVYPSPEFLVQQRMARLLSDLILDFVWGTLLPVWMYQPILKTYYLQKDHGDSIAFTENSAREVERVFVLSWWSYVLSIMPFCNSMLNLIEVRALLREESVVAELQHQSTSNITLVRLRTVIPGDDRHQCHDSSPSRSRRFIKRATRQLVHALHIMIAGVGVAMFIVTLIANDAFKQQPEEGEYRCLHRVYPWFTSKESCVGRVIDCESLVVEGSVEDIEAGLRVFDHNSLADLFISNCPALNLSTRILQDLPGLQSLVITNSTIVSWDEEMVSLEYKHFPDLRTVKLETVQFVGSSESVALFTRPLSKTVEWVYIYDTDMKEALELRTDLVGDHWSHLIYFDCASCSLSVFPSQVVDTMSRLIMLSLIDNNIELVPHEWPLERVQLAMLWFDGNVRLRSLPDVLWRQASSTLQSVYAQNTNLSSLPEWLSESANSNSVFQVFAHGTPLCAKGAGPAFLVCDSQEL